MKYYHGTSTVLPIQDYILPAMYTGIKREQWRTKHCSVVFSTTSKLSACKYAKKCVSKYGGQPVVYQVKPMGNLQPTIFGEYISDKAKILHKEYKKGSGRNRRS